MNRISYVILSVFIGLFVDSSYGSTSIFPGEDTYESEKENWIDRDHQTFDIQIGSKKTHPAAPFLSKKGVRFGTHFELPFFYKLRTTEKFIPASVTKLFITGTALQFLGPNYRIPTHLKGNIQNGILYNAVINGSGDPTWGMEEFKNDDDLKIKTWAEALFASGVHTIHGSLSTDSTDPRWSLENIKPDGWAERHSEKCYAAIPGAFNFQENCINGRPGPLAAQRAGIQWIRTKLSEQGIVFLDSDPTSIQESESKPFVSTVYSAPLIEILKPFMKKSINFIGESIFLHLGLQHSNSGTKSLRLNAKEIVKKHLQSRIPSLAYEIEIHDGSGLSDWNRISPASAFEYISELIRSDDWANIRSTFTIAGVDGTLKNRMKGSIAEGKILGKTGTLGKMANLVGIMETNKGDEPFVILGEGTSTAQTRGRIDQALIKTTEYIYKQN